MEKDRLRHVPILLAVLAMLAGATPASAQLFMTLNQTAFHPGEVLEVAVAVRNSGPTFSADVYVGTLLPDGTAMFLTSLSPRIGVVTTLDANPRSFPPLLADVVVPVGLDTTIGNFLSYAFSEQQPRGEYSVFAALVRAGSIDDGQIAPGDLVFAVVQPFTLVDVGTGLRTAEITVIPSSPRTSDAISVRLSGVWSDSCSPHSPQVRITGSEVRIDTAGVPPGVLCATVLTPWELVVPVGQLPVGSYRIVVIHSSQGQVLELGRKAFDVR